MRLVKNFITGIGFALAAIFVATSASAQGMPQFPKLPLDSAVRYGVLPNGLTYYIRHNELPKGQADFYIAQKVGSILEEENQRGLAHFLEHMCFNGTENFPGNSLIDYLESVGVKFGTNLNAYTSVDETVYNITNVPTARESVQDSVLLILHDWADALLLDPEEIDKERGVIHQEWRRSMVGQMRIVEKVLPDMYPDSRYGYRLPIGIIDVIDNFKPQEIRDYYETWYRPDQQGVIVVGDIDVDRIENKIKELFSPIQMPAEVKERVYFPVEDNQGTLFAIGTDPEQRNAIVELMFKEDAIPAEMKGTQMELMMNFMQTVISLMLDERLTDIGNQPDAPFATASTSYGEYFISKTKDAFLIYGLPKDGDVKPVLESVYREALRAARGGFTQGEYDRAKAKYLSTLESAYNNRNNVETAKYVREYVRHFIDGDPAPGIETEWEFAKQIVPMLSLMVINQAFAEMITLDNRVVLVMLPEGENYPVPAAGELTALMAAVDAEDIEPYKDEMREDPFIPYLPDPGKIVSEQKLEQWDATELMMSNGVKVIVKPTKFKDDEIRIAAQALGGIENLAVEDSASILFMELALGTLGYGDYTNSDVEKYLAGKKVSFMPSADFYSREISSQTTPKDLQTAFELFYNYFTNPSFDENEYNAVVGAYTSVLANQESQPQYRFSKIFRGTIYSDPRRQLINTEAIKQADRGKILGMIKKMTANASDYTFVIVGNVDMETLKPLLEQYVATLPVSADGSLKYEPSAGYELVMGDNTKTVQIAMQTPQTYVGIVVPATLGYTAKDRALIMIAGQILSKRLLNTVREDMGAVYSIGASGVMLRQGVNNAYIMSSFPMKPEMKDEVLDFIRGQFDDMTRNIDQEEFGKVVEYMAKTAVEDKEKNGSWVTAIRGWLMNGVDTFNGDEALYKSLVPDDVKNVMKRIMDQGNYRVVIVEPDAVEAPAE